MKKTKKFLVVLGALLLMFSVVPNLWSNVALANDDLIMMRGSYTKEVKTYRIFKDYEECPYRIWYDDGTYRGYLYLLGNSSEPCGDGYQKVWYKGTVSTSSVYSYDVEY